LPGHDPDFGFSCVSCPSILDDVVTHTPDPDAADLIASLPPLFVPDERQRDAEQELQIQLMDLRSLDPHWLELERPHARLLWSVVTLDEGRFSPTDALSRCGWRPRLGLDVTTTDSGLHIRSDNDPDAGWKSWIKLALDKRGRLTLPPAARAHLGVGLYDRLFVGTQLSGSGSLYLVAPAAVEADLPLDGAP
jgi:hypothetical protein